jgi:hypothetical protein
MAGTIQLKDIGKHCTQKMEKLLRVAVFQTDFYLKKDSPVDLGRFRASWQVGENSASGGIAPPGKYPSAPSIVRLGYSRETLGNVYSVHNNLPYAERLANGWSDKAPRGWVQVIAKNMQSYIVAQAAKIGKES